MVCQARNQWKVVAACRRPFLVMYMLGGCVTGMEDLPAIFAHVHVMLEAAWAWSQAVQTPIFSHRESVHGQLQ